MEDQVPDKYVREASLMREKLVIEGVPLQKEVIDNLTVGSIEDKIGLELARSVNNAFDSPAQFSSDSVRNLGRKLQGLDPTSNSFEFAEKDPKRFPLPSKYDVREIEVSDEHNTKKYLVRKSKMFDGRLHRTDIFEFPEEITDDITHVQYKYYLLTDTNTGKTADLIEAIKPSTQVNYEIPYGFRNLGHVGNHAPIGKDAIFFFRNIVCT